MGICVYIRSISHTQVICGLILPYIAGDEKMGAIEMYFPRLHRLKNTLYKECSVIKNHQKVRQLVITNL